MMPVRLRNYTKIFISLCLVLTFCLVEGDAQTKRKRTRRAAKPAAPKPVITNPTIAPPTTATPNRENTGAAGDVKIISTADSTTDTTEPDQTTETKKPKAAATSNESGESQEDMQKTITNLSKQVDRLADKLSQMHEDDRYQLDMERLTRAEQRAEQLRMQLVEVQSKIADLESQLEGIEFALRPENIERATATFGSTRPEEARQARQRQLESERTRVKAQLRILHTSQSRLEVSCANADNEVDLLRAKLQQRREQMEINAASGESRPKKKPDQQP
jgi:chromosome segregation ATPase